MKRFIIITSIALSLLSLFVITNPVIGSYLRGNPPFSKTLSNVTFWNGVPGPEDMAIIRNRGLIVISSEERRGNGKATGALYFINLTLPVGKQQALRLSCNYPSEFRPHGLSFRQHNGSIELYVISHKNNGRESVEIFSLSGPNTRPVLKHIKTIPFNEPERPNDITVIEDGTFFLSHDSIKNKSALLNMLFSRPFVPISYFDGHAFHIITNYALMGNGIIHRVSGTNLIIYRADTLLNRINVLSLTKDKTSYRIISSRYIPLPASPDNLTFDKKGNIYAACHYSFSKFFAHAKGKSPSPAIVYRINTDESVNLIYANDGKEYSAASVAVPYKNRLYLGDVFDDHIMSGIMK